MFRDILGMVGTLEERKVGRYEDAELLVSTVRNTDSERPFETAVSSPEYNDGRLVIVEEYDDNELAVKGHGEWVKKMTAETKPSSLKDVLGSGIAQLADIVEPDPS